MTAFSVNALSMLSYPGCFDIAAGTTGCVKFIIYLQKTTVGDSLRHHFCVSGSYDGYTRGCPVLDIWQGRLILDVVQYKTELLSSGCAGG